MSILVKVAHIEGQRRVKLARVRIKTSASSPMRWATGCGGGFGGPLPLREQGSSGKKGEGHN